MFELLCNFQKHFTQNTVHQSIIFAQFTLVRANSYFAFQGNSKLKPKSYP